MNGEIHIRLATVEDASALRDIYAYYVRTMAVTFETEVPSLGEYAARIEKVLASYPYLVAVCNEEIIGFAYASSFNPRKGYDHSVETSIYIRHDRRGGGAGRRLYAALEKLLALQGVYNMNACIAYCEPADEYVPATSRLFHEACGFTLVGRFTKCARKFDRWYDMIWMEKLLAQHPEAPQPFVSFPSVDQEQVSKLLS